MTDHLPWTDIRLGFVTKISSSETYTLFQGAHNLPGETQIYGYEKIHVRIFIQCNAHYMKGMGKIPWKQGEVVMNSAGWFWLHLDMNIRARL